MMPQSRPWHLCLLVLAAAACSEHSGLVSPEPEAPSAPVAAVSCTANVRQGALACSPAAAPSAGGARFTVVGGQDLNVKLTSSNVVYSTADGGVLSADITVQNLLGQKAMGGDSAIRVFFHLTPVVTDGTGQVTVRNADGSDAFTGSRQPYFAYEGTLQPGETSEPKRWEWSVPASVGQFVFTLYVDAPLADRSPGAGLAFRTISAQGQNVCGVTLDAEGWCWGHTAWGQLGAGPEWFAQGVTYRPVRVQNGPWDAITVGDHGACGLKQGAAWCWGNDLDGGLGTGGVSRGCGGTNENINIGCSPVPVKVTGEFSLQQLTGGPEVHFLQISAGGNLSRDFGSDFSRFTCGVNPGGQAFCWGSDGLGTLGDGRQYPLANPAPQRVLGDRVYRKVTAGYRHACAMDEQGKAWCWGKGISGELGYAPPDGEISATPGAVQGGHTFLQIAAGAAHTCGITTALQVWCWGSNGHGQLGTDDVTTTCNGFLCSPAPVRVESELKFVQVASGQFHTCALTAEGDAWCWGREWLVGRGAEVSGSVPCTSNPGIRCMYTPVQAQTSERFVQVAAARNGTCAIGRTSRKVFCWGTDGFALAQGVGGPVYVPTRIVEPASSD
jgi:alpha-tubulin suppressor-like RCC1 family protein